jgi:hypothetical protein
LLLTRATAPVASFFAWIGAPSTAAPLGSEMVPVREPFSLWAELTWMDNGGMHASKQIAGVSRDIDPPSVSRPAHA